MSELSSAEENLRVIRSLMERATVYRAISAPAALIAGLLAIAAGVLYRPAEPRNEKFILLWSAVLAVAMAVNLWFLYRENRRRGAPFFSPGMRTTLLAMAPALLVGGLATLVLYRDPMFLPPAWMLTYGLALLATSHFAPRSLVVLGVTFFVTSFGWVVLALLANDSDWMLDRPGLWMAGTFGLFHLLYALAAWPRKAVSDV